MAFGNDPDADRHGIVTPVAGLMNPNHYLAVAIHYLLTHRPEWSARAAVGKTLVSSSLIDRVVHSLGRRLVEVPVGFKWFAEGLLQGTLCFGARRAPARAFCRKTAASGPRDKDGPVMDLLAAEMTARTGKDPGEHHRELSTALGASLYTRIDVPATPQQKAALQSLAPETVEQTTLAGEAILGKLTRASGNGAPIRGLKVIAANGWFAARPSGTENFYKIYAESFRDPGHLDAIVREAQQIVDHALKGSTAAGASTESE